MTALTCRGAVRAGSDDLAGLLSDAERGALEDHLAGCDSCACLMDQLRTTVAVLESRPDVQLPDTLRSMVNAAGGGRGEALTAQLPHLYALANALDPESADDLVQDTITSALADPDADTTPRALAAALTRLADNRGPDIQSPAVPAAGTDPDADEPELFYPGFYTDGPDAGAWIDSPVSWGEARVLGPDADVLTSEVYGVVDAALAGLDPVDAALITLIDIEGAPFAQAALELDLPSRYARDHLASARLAVRGALDRHIRS